jgi:hypothetical protein
MKHAAALSSLFARPSGSCSCCVYQAIMNAITSPDPSRKLFALEDINLSNNSAGHEGAEAVANVMSGNRILKKINCKNFSKIGVFSELLHLPFAP